MYDCSSAIATSIRWLCAMAALENDMFQTRESSELTSRRMRRECDVQFDPTLAISRKRVRRMRRRGPSPTPPRPTGGEVDIGRCARYAPLIGVNQMGMPLIIRLKEICRKRIPSGESDIKRTSSEWGRLGAITILMGLPHIARNDFKARSKGLVGVGAHIDY